MRLVLDTNVVVSGLIWGGPPRRLLDMGRSGRVFLFSSAILLDELADVLAREKFVALLAARKIMPAFLMQRYGMLATLANPAPVERTVPTDEDDDHVIATALGARRSPSQQVIRTCFSFIRIGKSRFSVRPTSCDTCRRIKQRTNGEK